MENTEKLQKKLASIKRGAHWFGLIGIMSMTGGFTMAVTSIFAWLAVYYNWPTISGAGLDIVTSGAGAGIPYLIYGYLFLLGRDAFEAIEELIREVGEIV